MIRYYLCDVLAPKGTGDIVDRSYRPAIHDIVGHGWTAIDGRLDERVAVAKAMLVRMDTTLLQHTTLTADPRIQHITQRAGLPLRIRLRLLGRWTGLQE